jgi:hypothetical protein
VYRQRQAEQVVDMASQASADLADWLDGEDDAVEGRRRWTRS